MGQRNKQHMGRSTDEDRTLIGRDIQDGDVVAERAERNYDFAQPNEEGTDSSPEQAAERGSGQDAAGRGGADEARGDAGRDTEGRAERPRRDDGGRR